MSYVHSLQRLESAIAGSRAALAERSGRTRQYVDAVAFAQSLNFEPDAWQVAALRWTGRAALWNCARQTGKSTIAALLAVHRAVFYSRSLVLLVSPSLRQSSELFRKVADWLSKLPDAPKLIEDNKLSCTLTNASRVVSLPSSESTIRGFSSVDLLIADEAARIDDSLYRSTRPMLAVSRGKLIAMSTPFGRRGWWSDAWHDGGDSWERVLVPATECPRISAEFLASEPAALGDWWYRQEYLCEFVEAVDGAFDYNSVMGAISNDVQPLFVQPELAA